MKKVAILGCGPAGLLVAHAAALSGVDFLIISKKRQSQLFGCQYLHHPIPEITDMPHIVSYRLTGGSSQEYAMKVYNGEWDGKTSPDDLAGDHMAYDIRSAYQKLWNLYSDYIVDYEIVNEQAITVSKAFNVEAFDAVISTIPRTVWKRPGDTFYSAKVWAIGDAPDRGQQAPFRPGKDFQVICDASKEVGWYRLSQVFGYTTIEWPHKAKPPVPGAVEVEKPLTCKAEGGKDFVHLGRYGEWRKGVLTTDAFYRAMELMAK